MPFFGLKHLLLSTRASFLPAFIFAAAVFYGLGFPIRAFENNVLMHWSFLLLAAAGTAFFVAAKQVRLLFMMLAFAGTYLLLNGLKFAYGSAYTETAPFAALFLLLPLNAFLFLKMPAKPLTDQTNFYLLCLILGQGVLIENLPADFHLIFGKAFFYATWLIWALLLTIMLMTLAQKGSILWAGVFFAMLSVLGGILESAQPEGLCLYFAAAALILICAAACHLVYAYFRDADTGIYSNHTFYIHAVRRFPLKYSLGVICLDDYSKLCKVFKKDEIKILVKMVLGKMLESPAKPLIYRHTEDEFILIFKNEDKKQSFQHLENIRRSVAGAEFMLDRRKPVKITVSAGVSEKKRSDADVEAVLTRTRDVLRKAYKFTQNMTSMA